MSELHPSPSRRPLRYWLVRLGMVVLGCGLAIAIVFGVLRAFPSLFPGLTIDGRARSLDAGTVVFTAGQGDLFVHRKGKIAPPPDPYEVLSEHRLAWDADGFRVPARAADQYPIIALGDSYTEAPNVAVPWPDVLAAETKIPVRNLGFRGYGPFEEANVLKDYALTGKPKLIVLAFYEGNDLSEAISVRWRDPWQLPSITRAGFGGYNPNDPIWKSDNPGPFQFPVRINLGGKVSEIAFLDSYLSWLYADPATYANSPNLRELGRALDEMTAAIKAQSQGTCLLVTYVPDKAHIYVPYLVPEDRDRALSTVNFMTLLGGNDIMVPQQDDTVTPKDQIMKPSYDEIVKRLGNQRDAVAALAKQKGLPFVDLTPAFEQAAAQGEITYYTYDTHWNQAGNTLAGKTLAAYLASTPTPCG